MKHKVPYIWIFGLVFSASLLLSGIYTHRMDAETNEIVSYITIGIDQENLATDRSLHDIQRAEEHFSDMVLGWTVAPDFVAEMEASFGEVAYSGRRQEKQNLIFTYSTDDMAYAEAFVDAIDLRINQYNDATFGTFNVARETHTPATQTHSKLRVFFGINLLVAILLMAGIFAFDYAYANRRRS